MESKFVEYRGFTLTELLATIAIAAIVMSMAVPNFMGTIRNNRLTSSTNEFITALKIARSEAIKRGLTVTVRKINNSSCTKGGANWEDGWDIFVDADANGVCDDGPDPALTLIRTHEALPNSFTLRGNGGIANYISYQPNGTSNTFGSFVMCDNSDNNNIPEPYTSKMLIVNFLGRIEIAKDEKGAVDEHGNVIEDGIPEDNLGNPITSCLPPF